MIVELKLFALAKQLAAADTVRLEVEEPATVGQLRSKLADEFPALASITSHLLFAVNASYADDATAVPESAEVACFPPVSGG